MRTTLVAKALIIDEERNCLMLRRSKTHPHSPLAPDLPGGQLEENESPDDAVIREIYEETGLTIAPSDMHLVYSHTSFDRGQSFVRFLFIARISGVRPEVAISWEHSEAWWLPFDEAGAVMKHPEYAKGIKYITEHEIIDSNLS